MSTIKDEFKFKLNQEQFDHTVSDTIFESQLKDGYYIVTWCDEEETNTILYSKSEVSEAFSQNYWIILD